MRISDRTLHRPAEVVDDASPVRRRGVVLFRPGRTASSIDSVFAAGLVNGG